MPSNLSSQCGGGGGGCIWESMTVHGDDTESTKSNVMLQRDSGILHLSLTGHASQLPAQLSTLRQPFNTPTAITQHQLTSTKDIV